MGRTVLTDPQVCWGCGATLSKAWTIWKIAQRRAATQPEDPLLNRLTETSSVVLRPRNGQKMGLGNWPPVNALHVAGRKYAKPIKPKEHSGRCWL